MIYEYQDQQGKIVERQLSMHDTIPAEIVHDGRVYRRLYRATGILYRAPGFQATDQRDAVDRWKHEHLDSY